MKRAWVILVSGLALAAMAYGGFYYLCTANFRGMAHDRSPELAWLKVEFHLGDAEFKRISALHEAYVAGCAERCQRIDMTNAALKALLARTNTLTPEIEQMIAAAAQLHAECQRLMLQHCYEVSQTMPPEQGKRYLDWVHERTLHTDTHATMQP